MKKLLYFIFLLPLSVASQQSDSIDIIVGETRTRIAKPAQGQQTSIRFKDSLSQFEVRISNGSAAVVSKADSTEKKRTIKYFSQVSAGALTAAPLRTGSNAVEMNGYEYFTFTITDINPGFELALSLRKSSYRIADNFCFQSGLDYRFMTFSADAEYTSHKYDIIKIMQADSINPSFVDDYYQHDTAATGMRKIINQVSVPLMFQYRVSKSFAFSFGAAFDVSFTSTRIDHHGLDGDLYKEVQFSGPDYPRLQLRPQFSLDIGPFGLYISRDLANSRFGYGNSDKKTTKFTHIGLSYSLF